MTPKTIFGPAPKQGIALQIKRRILEIARTLVHREHNADPATRLTGFHVLVLEAMLFRFHGAQTQACFPSRETIAAYVGVAPSTVMEATQRLRDHGLLSWVHRIHRKRFASTDPASASPWRDRVLRTSNAYFFKIPRALRANRQLFTRSFTDNQRGQRNALVSPLPLDRERSENKNGPQLADALWRLLANIQRLRTPP